MNLLTNHIPPQAQKDIDEQAAYHQQVHQFFALDAEETETEQEAPEQHTNGAGEDDTEPAPDDAAHSVHVFVPPKVTARSHKKKHKK